jgi:hypothetical protein
MLLLGTMAVSLALDHFSCLYQSLCPTVRIYEAVKLATMHK